MAESNTGEVGKECKCKISQIKAVLPSNQQLMWKQKLQSWAKKNMRRMRGGHLRREKYRCATGKRALECMATSYSGKLAFGLQNLVCRHNFNSFGHNFINPYGGAHYLVNFHPSQTYSQTCVSHICYALLHCVTGILSTISFVDIMLPQHFTFWCGSW